MTVFIIVAALLVVITIALLFFPLLKGKDDKPEADSSDLSMQVLREQLQEVEKAQASGQMDAATADKEKRELERRAVEDSATEAPVQQSPVNAAVQRKFIIAAAVIIPLMAAGLYWMLGNPDTMKPGGTTEAPAGHAGGNHSLNPQQIAEMAEKLSERLATNPMDGEGWLMLGRSYAAIGRHAESAAALGRAVSILPPNPNYLADYADVLAMAQGRRLSGEPEKIIAQALSLDPNHIKALALSGSTAFEKGDYARAVSEWQKILMLVPADSGIAQGMKSSISDAQSRITPATGSAQPPAATKSPASVSGSVTLADGIKAQVSPTDTVFIFARPTEGPRMPLALRRMTVAQLPSDFTLDDSMAMTPSAKLSGARQVIVGARITKSGSATPQPGDFEGLTKPMSVGSKGIKLVIDTPVK